MTAYANTVFDKRNNSRKYPVWEAVIAQMSWADDATTAHTSAVGVNGIITQIVAEYSAGDGDPDLTLVIKDSAGNALLTKTDHDNQTVIYDADGTDFGQHQLTVNGFTVQVTSQDPGASGVTADVVVRGI